MKLIFGVKVTIGVKQDSRTNRAHAFTLVELLVVVAIIALLASILFPAFSRARENARRSSCLSNVKQIGLGIAQYTQDYDELLPFSSTTAKGGRWPNRIGPYVKNTQIFTCPSYLDNQRGIPGNFLYQNSASGWKGNGSTYAMNMNFSDYDDGSITIYSHHLAELVDPSNSALVVETAVLSLNSNALLTSPDNNDPVKWSNYINKSDPYHTYKGNSDWLFTPPTTWDGNDHCGTPPNNPSKSSYKCAGGNNNNLARPIGRHFDGLNIVYCDGHAKWVRIDRFLGPLPGGWPYNTPNNSWDNR